MNDTDRDWHGALVEARPVPCSACGAGVPVEIYYLIDTQAWPGGYQKIMSDDEDRFQCKKCGFPMLVRAPLIFHMPDRNLTVFATPRGDDVGVERGFRAFLESLQPHLSEGTVPSINLAPYTFVNGRAGLRALLVCLLSQDKSQEHTLTGDIEYVQVLSGYLYGAIFFYLPAQLAAQDMVGQVTAASSDLEASGEIAAALSLVQALGECIGYSHPWLVQALGRLLLENGKLKEAGDWLKRARGCNNCWHAVTQSFLDATPRRRDDGATQAAHLPTAAGGVELGNILDRKHTVTGLFSANADAPHWNFPLMAQAAIPEEYLIDNISRGCGTALGTFEKLFFEGRFKSLSEPTRVGWIRLQEKALALVEQLESDAGIFWGAYVSSRWGRPTAAGTSSVCYSAWFEMLRSDIKTQLEGMARRQSELRVEAEDDNPFTVLALGFDPPKTKLLLRGAEDFAKRGTTY